MRNPVRGLAGFLAGQGLLLVLCSCGSTGDGSGPNSPPPAADTVAPSVPQSVEAMAESQTSIVLSWDPSTDAGTGVAGYRVARSCLFSSRLLFRCSSFLDCC